MIGVFAFAALLPAFMAEWDLTNTQAGWLGGILFAGYAGAAPILVALTDRIDARRVFMAGAFLAGVANLAFALVADGFWSALVLRALAGVGLAGTYMPGLRVLVDRITAARRAGAVPLFTASFSLGSAISYLVPVLVAELAGWRGAFTVAGISALAAVAVIGWMPARPPEQPEDSGAGALLDFRPVFASRPTMGYALGYVAHMWELFAFRAWIVAFLGFAAVLPGAPGTGPAIGGAAGLLAPGVVATWGALVAMACSIGGARIATRFGRAGTTQVYMATSALMALVFGWLAGLPYPLLAGLAIVYAGLIQLDSAALTTGAVETAPAGRRGATLAVHSLLGFGAAFLGPLGFGIVLDLAGGRESMTAWGIAFGMLGVIGLLGIPPLRMARRSRHGPASVPPAC
ncbi:MFS transporter [Roseospira marina]|uniref:MFS transporter n=2 Tax=Roseospira marina TaxID=140057 RepID=A0A5M6IAA2_9PROT|nr:MFS transporter [Roseospira marina]